MQQLQENPYNLQKEVEILFELGLEDYEVEYLVFLKDKVRSRKKWE